MAFIDLCGVPDGYLCFALADILKKHKRHCHIAPNEKAMALLAECMRITAPHIKTVSFAPWDTVPYDRASPKPDIAGARIDVLNELAENSDEPLLIITTPEAVMQRVPPKTFFKESALVLKVGKTLPIDTLRAYLADNSYHAVSTVMERGEYAVRGGLVDLFSGGAEHPVRVDFFGDEIDSIRSFDEMTQRTLKNIDELVLKPVAEYRLTKESIALFRTKYRSLFFNKGSDYLYENVSNGVAVDGLEHFLPLFHNNMETLFDYLPNASFSLAYQAKEGFAARQALIMEYYEARKLNLNNAPLGEDVYYPIEPQLLFLDTNEIDEALDLREVYTFSPFVEPNKKDMGARMGQKFISSKINGFENAFKEAVDLVATERRRCVFTAESFGEGQHLSGLLRSCGLDLYEAHSFDEALKKAPSLLVAPFENGFYDKHKRIITKTDLLGERRVQAPRRRKSDNFIADVGQLEEGDYVVHQTHGIGSFLGLVPIETGGALHDCVALKYAKNDKLFIPVENLDVLSKYGDKEGNVELDTLGTQAFLWRKEKVKKDLFAMAERLIQNASLRALNQTERILPPQGLYQEFCLRFPYAETEDQLRTIAEIETDLAAGKPMDRLVCGDVGFGKTEIALRAAFLVAMAGYQVAVIAPTTLLAMQHGETFKKRFKDFPVRVDALSRLTRPKQAKLIKDELANGTLDIVIGTHALLASSVHFKRLGLVIVDEEQHFGVAHKERLKEIQKGAHVLTLTATPIPRTLQLSLAGVRELSVIATPPTDRLAVKTFITPFDGVIIREALLREHFRGGQVFVVCPRISDMPELKAAITELVPDLKLVAAHGQMSPANLEKIMQDFSDKKYDILLATSIVESGLDLPSVNTIIVHRADMFGLAALYQLRGRVGRSKQRAYAYLTTPAHRLGDTAQKRLKVMQSLDRLGAGFTLASHDLDIRGAGNLLGKEQSGHIRQIGVALYQKMLADAINELKSNPQKIKVYDFSPQISVGLPVFIPESYVPDFQTRMRLYNKIGNVQNEEEIDLLKEELTDCFGLIPEPVENLLITVRLKLLCRKACIERLDVGDKGATVSFWKNVFPNPKGLVDLIAAQMGTMRLRPDQKLVVMRPFDKGSSKIKAVEKLISQIAALCVETNEKG